MIIGAKIRQAREIRGLTQKQLADKIGKSKAIVAQVEGGFKQPSEELLNSISFATGFPISFFTFPPHLEFPINEVLFRARSNIRRREVLSGVRIAEHAFSIGAYLATFLKRVPVRIPVEQTDPIKAARLLREVMEIEWNFPVSNLIRSLERLGVWVIAIPQMEGGDGFCVWVNADIPIIAVSAQTSGDRLRLSVAHELAHLILHRNVVGKSQKTIESEAFTFAAELLMPETAMRVDIAQPVTLSSISPLKPKWRVSIAALVRRAHELRIITTRQYHYLFQQLSALGWRMREPGALDIPTEKPRLLRNMAELVFGHPVDYQKFAAATHVSEQELRSIMSLYADRKESPPAEIDSKVLSFPTGGKSTMRI